MSDLIDRQQAINALYEINPSSDYLFIDAVVDMLENLPSQKEKEVKVIYGLYPHSDLAYNVYLCGACSKPLPWMEIGRNYDEMPKYCSHCGAKLIWRLKEE